MTSIPTQLTISQSHHSISPCGRGDNNEITWPLHSYGPTDDELTSEGSSWGELGIAGSAVREERVAERGNFSSNDEEEDEEEEDFDSLNSFLREYSSALLEEGDTDFSPSLSPDDGSCGGGGYPYDAGYGGMESEDSWWRGLEHWQNNEKQMRRSLLRLEELGPEMIAAAAAVTQPTQTTQHEHPVTPVIPRGQPPTAQPPLPVLGGGGGGDVFREHYHHPSVDGIGERSLPAAIPPCYPNSNPEYLCTHLGTPSSSPSVSSHHTAWEGVSATLSPLSNHSSSPSSSSPFSYSSSSASSILTPTSFVESSVCGDYYRMVSPPFHQPSQLCQSPSTTYSGGVSSSEWQSQWPSQSQSISSQSTTTSSSPSSPTTLHHFYLANVPMFGGEMEDGVGAQQEEEDLELLQTTHQRRQQQIARNAWLCEWMSPIRKYKALMAERLNPYGSSNGGSRAAYFLNSTIVSSVKAPPPLTTATTITATSTTPTTAPCTIPMASTLNHSHHLQARQQQRRKFSLVNGFHSQWFGGGTDYQAVAYGRKAHQRRRGRKRAGLSSQQRRELVMGKRQAASVQRWQSEIAAIRGDGGGGGKREKKSY